MCYPSTIRFTETYNNAPINYFLLFDFQIVKRDLRTGLFRQTVKSKDVSYRTLEGQLQG